MSNTPEEPIRSDQELDDMIEEIRRTDEAAIRERQQNPPPSNDAARWKPGDPEP